MKVCNKIELQLHNEVMIQN